MSSNWLFLAIAALFVAAALALVLYPLFRRKPAAARAGRRSINIAVYRDQLKEMETDRANGLIGAEQFETAKIELEARLAQDAVEAEDTQPVSKGGRILGGALAVAIPIAAFALYFTFGSPQALQGVTSAGQPTPRDIQAMLQAAEDKVKANPNDTQTWVMLARAYGVLERWPDAIRAYENLTRLAPGEAAVWSHYGEALALSNGKNLDGKPMELIRKALAIDPKDVKALELSGIYAFQHKDYKAAVKNWQQVVDQSPPGEQYTQEMQSALAQARQLAGEAPAGGSKLDNLSSADSGNPPAATGKGVTGTVELAANLKGKAAPGDTVFLFARDSQAGGPPLAALRMAAGGLPGQFDLNDSEAMMPGSSLSAHATVTLTARISKTGNATPQPGDLEGEVRDVKVGSSGVKVVIDKVRK